MKDAQGHGSNGIGALIKARRAAFGNFTTKQPSVSNVQAVEALKSALRPPAPVHDAMSGNDLVRGMRGPERGVRDFSDNPITTLKSGFGRRGIA